MDNACPATFGNGPKILAATNNDPSMAAALSTPGVHEDKNDAISPAVQDDFAAHDRAISTAIANVLVTPQCSSTTPTAATLTSIHLMALLEQSLSRSNDMLLALVRMDNKKSCAIAKGNYDALLGRLNLSLSKID
jgi:hypothetical protein